ncbi:HNH endonuclease signature motif containing protein, partial [Gordonia rhizosphera]
SVAHDRRVAAEATLADLARRHTPAEITSLGARLLAHLDPDGEITDDKDRARQRKLSVTGQGVDQMSKLTGHLDPETRGLLDVMLAAWAKPGMNNPGDSESPSGAVDDADPDVLKAAVCRDDRTQPQRNHDALKALLTAVLTDGMLGKTNRGLPIQLIIKADLGDLIREAGFGITAGGTQLPMSDVIRLAAHAQPWLAVFKDSSAIPLFFGQGKRFATTPQRLASFARPDGHFCSAPGCDQPATHVEMHHSRLDFAKGGKTDIVDLAPACPKHNRMVNDEVGGFTTGVHDIGPDAGRTWWRRNSAPGAPLNAARVHRLPDVEALFDDNLTRARTDIHGPPGPAGTEHTETGTGAARPRFQCTQSIRPPLSLVEARLATQLALGR